MKKIKGLSKVGKQMLAIAERGRLAEEKEAKAAARQKRVAKKAAAR